ncbi:MAG: hypothetical protein DCC67_16720 [Planctomycetota bacterium]|nr:MAG: hypothetical protein DCC67_16720 [Planctomycetota bacterium]
MQTAPETIEEDVAYRQVSPAAVVALVLGVGSLVALVGPAFFLVPVAAVGVALLALGRIRRSGGALAGEGLARLAIALAIACTAAALVRQSVRDNLMQRQAVQTAQEWLDRLAKGRIKDARDLLTGDAASSLLPSREPGQPPPDPADAEQIILDRLRSDPLTRALAAASAAPTLDSAAPPQFEGPRAVVAAVFTVPGAASDDHRHATVQASRLRQYEDQGRPWRIDRWTIEPAHAAHQ